VAAPITPNSTLTDVCFAVCTALDAVGTIAVLTGGSAATYYAPERYQSRDADFILTMYRVREAGPAALEQLGFCVGEDQIYRHERTKFTLEFPHGPLAIGAELIKRYETVRRDDQVLHIISRTDSVRDRLAAFFHWSDRSALVTALGVAESGDIDLAAIKAWSEREGEADKFREFSDRLRHDRRTGRDH